MDEQTRKPREPATDEQRAERRDREKFSRKVAQDADDANVQAMIERSLKHHGP